jgi:predicted small lipoprotein YifL
MARMRPLALFVLLALLAGCGQSGPLYFRDQPPDSQLSPSQRKARDAQRQAEAAAAAEQAAARKAAEQKAAETAAPPAVAAPATDENNAAPAAP